MPVQRVFSLLTGTAVNRHIVCVLSMQLTVVLSDRERQRDPLIHASF
ncbi:hypothetical protein SAMN03084138_02777 [Enterovibrio norvegicus DSM 15893]|uniref:Uncharacterized protein n=1 Tax=Enterovibrio norvegicus DSM 15893 TaxID=1121869 RepID=A0A1I5S4Z4_9GAMM|nr:hypothetical protein SAMN03084138_02777 [Enterovibrio norvegicus DSM 15893]